MAEDNAKDLMTITLTKEQWEEVYQWYLVANEEYYMQEIEHAAAKHIASTLKNKYGSFR